MKILGSGGAIPANHRNPSAQLVSIRNHTLLLDCGEATQMQIKKISTGSQGISHIFISHLHGDHFYGLIGLISSYHLLARKRPLHVYGMPGLQEIIEIQLSHSNTELMYPLHFHEINPDKSELLVDNDHFSVRSIPLEHRIPTSGFLVKEKPLKRNILKSFVDSVEIPFEVFERIRNGEDFVDKNGKVYPNQEITSDPPKPKSYAYCSDTAYHEPVIKLIKGADILYHESTFADDREKDALEKGHATARQAATIAKKAGVGSLVIGHFSARYKDISLLVEQAREVFPKTIAADDGMVLEV